MKKYLLLGLLFVALILPASSAQAVYVHGYYRSNGTYVNGYNRTAPDGNPYNNYSYPGNYNPNTGSITGGSAATYLNNYYNSSSGSGSGSSYINTYTPPVTPTCPANSYYDGISSCKCNSGYLVSGSSCVYASTVCAAQIGYSSRYDSLSNTCKCNYGYSIGSSGLCTLDQPTTSYYQTPTTSCPAHSTESLTDSTKCSCVSGYETNSSRNGCVLSVVRATSTTEQDLQAQVNALLIELARLQALAATKNR